MLRILMMLSGLGFCACLLAGCTEEPAGTKEPAGEKPLEKAASAVEKATEEVGKVAGQAAEGVERQAEQAEQALQETGEEVRETMAAIEAGEDPFPEAGKEVYQKSCAVCHAAGMAGAPKTGDQAAWKPRIAKGMETLVENTLQGIGAMPPKGGNAALSEEEVRAAVIFMVGRSR